MARGFEEAFKHGRIWLTSDLKCPIHRKHYYCRLFTDHPGQLPWAYRRFWEGYKEKMSE